MEMTNTPAAPESKVRRRADKKVFARLSEAERRALHAAAAKHGMRRGRYLQQLVRKALARDLGADLGPARPDTREALTARVDPGLARDIRAMADSSGTSLTEAVQTLLLKGYDVHAGADAIPSGKASQVLAALARLNLLAERLAPYLLANVRITAWLASRQPGQESDDALLAQALSRGSEDLDMLELGTDPEAS